MIGKTMTKDMILANGAVVGKKEISKEKNGLMSALIPKKIGITISESMSMKCIVHLGDLMGQHSISMKGKDSLLTKMTAIQRFARIKPMKTAYVKIALEMMKSMVSNG